MIFDRKSLSPEQLIRFYRELVRPRLIEEKMLVLLRQGRISKWFSGIGQEAIAVGAALAMDPKDWILPLHRNLGVFTVRGMPLHRLYSQWKGHKEGYSKGRERSFHFGSREYHICGMISHLGPQLGVANGIALGEQLDKSGRATLVFSGEGGTSEGDFHEALNIAAVWDLPVIFLVENNGYGLSTPVREQYRCRQLADRAPGYGMQGLTLDGNNLLEVYHTLLAARDYAVREQKPVLVECMTFRMRGHEEASGTKYIPAGLFSEWELKDPVRCFGLYLQQAGILGQEARETIQRDLRAEIEADLARASEDPPFVAGIQEELDDIYAPAPVFLGPDPASPQKEMRFVEAISEGLNQAMEHQDRLILMGQDIAAYGGAFKVSEGLLDRYGPDRVRNTPLCESAIVGAALGLSLLGYKSVVEMQFADFVTCAFNQVVNNLAKFHYRWGQPADTVIRMPTGAGLGAGPFHSQSNEAWFFHTPGLKILYPSDPEDAKGLLIAAIEDPNPVLFFEHKALYRSLSGFVPQSYYATPIGKARLVRRGEECSIITYGAGVHWALEYGKKHPDCSLEILDLRSLLPLDLEAIRASAEKTGKVLVLHEDTLTGGIGAEIAAWIGQHCFQSLDSPVFRCASLDTPVPFSGELERQFLAKSQLESEMDKLLRY